MLNYQCIYLQICQASRMELAFIRSGIASGFFYKFLSRECQKFACLSSWRECVFCHGPNCFIKVVFGAWEISMSWNKQLRDISMQCKVSEKLVQNEKKIVECIAVKRRYQRNFQLTDSVCSNYNCRICGRHRFCFGNKFLCGDNMIVLAPPTWGLIHVASCKSRLIQILSSKLYGTRLCRLWNRQRFSLQVFFERMPQKFASVSFWLECIFCRHLNCFIKQWILGRNFKFFIITVFSKACEIWILWNS